MTAIVVACPHCKHTGAVDCSPASNGTAPAPISATDGFHIETGRTSDGEALVICDACDEIIMV